jgi:hypothetical protein
MFGGIQGRLSALMCAGAAAAALAAGCGGDDESTAKDEQVDVPAASEPAQTFIERMAKLIETTTKQKDCAELSTINVRSATQFPCPAPKALRNSMAKFEVVGAEEYGTGAVIDYKSGTIKDGAAITLSVSPDRNWGIGRFGIVTNPSTDTSDEKNREGYAKAADEFLKSIRDRDCDAYVAVTFNGDDKKEKVCKETFPSTKSMAKLLKSNPDAKPHYEGGNAAYGFYSLETAKPKPASVTFSIAKSTAKGPRPFVVLDVTPSPTAAQQKKAEKNFKKQQKPGQDMEPSSKPVDN